MYELYDLEIKNLNYNSAINHYIKLASIIENDEEFLKFIPQLLNFRVYIKDFNPFKDIIVRIQELVEKNKEDDETKIYPLLTLVIYFFISNQLTACKKYAEILIPIAVKYENYYAIYFSYSSLAAFYFFSGQLAKVEETITEAFKFKKDGMIQERESYNYSLLALSQSLMGKKKESLKNAIKGIQSAYQSTEISDLALSLHYAGYAHSCLGEPEQGIEFSQEALQISKKINNVLLDYSSHFSLALGYLMQDILKESEEHLLISIEMAQKMNLVIGLNWVYINILETYFRRKDKRNFEACLSELKKFQGIFGSQPYYLFCVKKFQGILNLFYNDYLSAETNLLEALDLSKDPGSPNPIEEGRICGLLYLVYQELGDYASSSLYFKGAKECFENYNLVTDKKYYLVKNWAESTETSTHLTTGSSQRSIKEALAYESILRATASISAIQDPKKMIIKLMDIFFQTFGAEKASLSLKIKGRNFSVCCDKNLKKIEKYFVFNSFILKSENDKSPFIIQNASVQYPDEASGEKSVFIYPIFRKNNKIGSLYLSNSSLPGVFSSEDIKILSSIMNQALIAIENAVSFTLEKEARAKAEATMRAFQLFVPPQFLEVIASEGIEKIKLGNATQKKASILFSDIRDFTSISESMKPEELMIFLNDYMRNIAVCIEEGSGFIDKFIGDAILAIFDHESADHALLTAMDMQKKLALFNKKIIQEGKIPLKIGIGLNTGLITMGTIGTERRMDSTVIGDVVNLSSRLESLTKSYGIPVIVSANTIKSLQNPDMFHYREIDSVAVKGKNIPVTIYEVYGFEDENSIQLKKSYESELLMGISLYKIKEFENALEFFHQCLEKNSKDSVIQVYIKRCEQYLKNPPDEDWDGAVKLYEK